MRSFSFAAIVSVLLFYIINSSAFETRSAVVDDLNSVAETDAGRTRRQLSACSNVASDSHCQLMFNIGLCSNQAVSDTCKKTCGRCQGSTCPTGWVPYERSCFLVIDIPTLDVNDAKRNCQKLGGDLPKITSAAENNFITNLLKKQKKITAAGAWLGLYRKADKTFSWLDGTPLTGYTAWSPGEPNNYLQSGEDCVHVYPSGPGKYKWNDLPCTLHTSRISYAPVVLCQKYSN